jgi:threonine synthase
MVGMGYPEVAARVMAGWLRGFSFDELLAMCTAAYRSFDTPGVAPLSPLSGGRYILELFHGPTLAFKDVALQILPRFMAASAKKTGETRELIILVATSATRKGRAGGLRGGSGGPDRGLLPDGGVSEAQRLQMVTQEGDNASSSRSAATLTTRRPASSTCSPTARSAITCPTAAWPSPPPIRSTWAGWCRRSPTTSGPTSAWSRAGRVPFGRSINVCVPTGNFGNILAAWYAKEMGLPIKRLICASNQNNVLADFINNGAYDRNRPFYQTTSPSMDILISSNLERLLYELCGRDAGEVRAMMANLASPAATCCPRRPTKSSGRS